MEAAENKVITPETKYKIEMKKKVIKLKHYASFDFISKLKKENPSSTIVWPNGKEVKDVQKK